MSAKLGVEMNLPGGEYVTRGKPEFGRHLGGNKPLKKLNYHSPDRVLQLKDTAY